MVNILHNFQLQVIMAKMITISRILLPHKYTGKYFTMHIQTGPEVNSPPVSDMMFDSKSLIAGHRYFLTNKF